MKMLSAVRSDLKKVSSRKRALVSQRFFKTGVGEYGEGDIFVGAPVPAQRKIAIKYKDLPFSDIQTLLSSKIHEERFVALEILVYIFKKGDKRKRQEIVKFYLSNTKGINNWDLVDTSCYHILGESLIGKPLDVLVKLSKSKSLWERRIAMVSTFAFIRHGEYKQTFQIAEKLISDKNDLIQKAVGWMLREVGKKCGHNVEEEFLRKHYKQMGRTALRYSIEHFDLDLRKKYLAGQVQEA